MAKPDPDERLAKLKRELGWSGDAPPQAGGARIVMDAVTEKAGPAVDRLTAAYRRVRELQAAASVRVRSRPAASMLVAIGSGYAFGRIMRLPRRTGRARRAPGRAVAAAPAKAPGGFDFAAALQAGMSAWRMIEARLDSSKTRPAADRPM